MSTMVTVVIADDHPIFRKGLREVIDADPTLRVVAETADGESALSAIAELRPDVAVLDVDMPGRDGFEVVRAVRDRRVPTEIIFLTMHKEERFLDSALAAGVKGYVLKDGAVTDIIAAIKAVKAGQHFISPALSTLLVSRTRRVQKLASGAPGLETLSPTERKVLKLLAEFKTTKEIADVLCVSPRTVDHHRANIAFKLDLRGSHALTRFAVAHQSVIPDP
jgi:DNA-binding NarL/FixJ family response regulator